MGIYNSAGPDFPCVLTILFLPGKLNIETNDLNNQCGFGHSVRPDFTYDHIDNSIPQYFIDGHGDTMYFEGLTVDKYLHRFD